VTTAKKASLKEKDLLCLVHQFLRLFAAHVLESLDFTTSLVVFTARALHSLLQPPALVPQRLFAFGKLLCQVFGFLNLISSSSVILIVYSAIPQPKNLVPCPVHRQFLIRIEERLIGLVQGWVISGPRATCGPRKHSEKIFKSRTSSNLVLRLTSQRLASTSIRRYGPR